MFNRYINYNNARKMLSELAAQNVALLASKINEMTKNTTGLESEAKRDIIQRETEAILMRLLENHSRIVQQY